MCCVLFTLPVIELGVCVVGCMPYFDLDLFRESKQAFISSNLALASRLIQSTRQAQIHETYLLECGIPYTRY